MDSTTRGLILTSIQWNPYLFSVTGSNALHASSFIKYLLYKLLKLSQRECDHIYMKVFFLPFEQVTELGSKESQISLFWITSIYNAESQSFSQIKKIKIYTLCFCLSFIIILMQPHYRWCTPIYLEIRVRFLSYQPGTMNN